MPPQQQRIRDAFVYNADTGELRNAYTRNGKVKKDALAGSVRPRGYIQILFEYKYYQAANIIWLIMTGDWPKGLVDHVDGNPRNNVWANLKDVTYRGNSCNTKRSRSGRLIGASKRADSGKWRSYITVGKQRTNLGTFNTEQEAHEKYLWALDRIEKGFM
jgi:hypothetical protein